MRIRTKSCRVRSWIVLDHNAQLTQGMFVKHPLQKYYYIKPLISAKRTSVHDLNIFKTIAGACVRRYLYNF